MIYLIGWRGRGKLIWLFAFAGPLLAVAFEGIFGRYFTLGLSLGFLSAGVSCWMLGRKWNQGQNRHTFGPLKFENWGIVYGVLGLLILPAAINAAVHGY
jgi:hypothetical protein